MSQQTWGASTSRESRHQTLALSFFQSPFRNDAIAFTFTSRRSARREPLEHRRAGGVFDVQLAIIFRSSPLRSHCSALVDYDSSISKGAWQEEVFFGP